MEDRPSGFEQFMAHFHALKAAAGEPARLRTFYFESKKVRQAADDLRHFLHFTDFERRVFHGRRKHLAQTPQSFEREWREYKQRWEPVATEVLLKDLGIPPELLESQDEPRRVGDVLRPDPEFDDEFDPRYHDGGGAIKLGL